MLKTSIIGLALFTFSVSSLALTANPVNGGIAVVPLPDQPAPPQPTYNGHPVLVRSVDGHWQAIVGIDLHTTPGIYHLDLHPSNRTIDFTVEHQDYPEQQITLKNQQQVNPDPQQLQRIHQELDEEIRLFATFDGILSARALSMTQLPVSGHQVLSAFGLQRFFNGEPRAPHSGLDLKASEGEPVRAPAAGRILMRKNLYFNGNTIMLDEGQGVVSMYCHLSRMDVHPGQIVQEGSLLGLAGHTGRATGPHLHWSISLNGVRINPRLLLDPNLNLRLIAH